MATHSSILAWTISWTEEPGGLQSMGLQRACPTTPHLWPSFSQFSDQWPFKLAHFPSAVLCALNMSSVGCCQNHFACFSHGETEAQRGNGVAMSHSWEGALLGARTQGASWCGQEAQGLVGQAVLVLWETVLTAKSSLHTLRASVHLGSGTGLSGCGC